MSDKPTATPRTAAALAARHAATHAALERVRQAVTRLRREKSAITVAAVARRADVSRTFCYDNPDARALIAHAIADSGAQRAQTLTNQVERDEASWRERALNAEDALTHAHAEIRTQRKRIGELLGQIRDLESAWTEEAVLRITTENSTLKQQARQLTAENRILAERLQAARENLRFHDRRVAELEAGIGSELTATVLPLARSHADRE